MCGGETPIVWGDLWVFIESKWSLKSNWHDFFLFSWKNAKKSTFTASDIEALLQDNKEKVHFAQPVDAGSLDPSKEELWLKHHFCSLGVVFITLVYLKNKI